jgi:outer membrane protein OmpA-like peptidoglycan-associated protein
MTLYKGSVPMKNQTIKVFCSTAAATALLTIGTFGQDKPGKLRITVEPPQAYTFIDGDAIGPGNQKIKLSAGTHHLMVANYGYKFAEQDIVIDSGHTLPLKIELQSAGGEVSGPRGRIQIEVGRRRAGDAAVLLNGKTPRYFVGHVDEFNNDIIKHQELVVPPGTHQITITRYGKELWSGSVTVAADERVILNISNGKEVTKPWPRGSGKLPAEVARFKAGVESTTVAVAPVSGSLSASPERIDCGRSSQLAWASNETIDADMSGMSPVPTSGERSVSPRQTTTYQLTAIGPGGVIKPSTTVQVNKDVQSSLSVSPTQVQYSRIGDKVLQQPNATLTWSSSNSDTNSISTIGPVDPSGTKTVAITPNQSGEGSVDQDITYTLVASNACGGSATKTATVHVTGSVEGVPGVLLRSVFFPTDYPTRQQPSAGLMNSQQEVLRTLAAGFNKYLEYDPDAKLSLSAYADGRGDGTYNQKLSELRVQRVKDFLVSQGVAADKIDTAAYGQKQQLDKTTVADLQAKNPNSAEKSMANPATTWLAYNRRVDIALLPTNTESVRFYPNDAADSKILWQRPKPEASAVEVK